MRRADHSSRGVLPTVLRRVWSRNIKNRCSIYIYIYIYIYDISNLRVNDLTLILLTWRKWWANNASKEQMGFNSVFKGLMVNNRWYANKKPETVKFCVLHTYVWHFVIELLHLNLILIFLFLSQSDLSQKNWFLNIHHMPLLAGRVHTPLWLNAFLIIFSICCYHEQHTKY